MKLTLIGCGCGPETLTVQARRAAEEAQLLIGAPRVLSFFPDVPEKREAKTGAEIRQILCSTTAETVCVLFSGDIGFYSGARTLVADSADTQLTLYPGISSLQLLAARLHEPWQDWHLCSAHGTDCDPVAAVCGGKSVFFLTGGKLGPAELCRLLTDADLGFLPVVVGENLGVADERLVSGRADELSAQTFAPLSVLLVRPAPRMERRVHGFPDELFLRDEKIPMTKQLVRAAALSLLGAGSEETCWDIGTGSGSVAIELAMQTKCVYGVERSEMALRLARENRKRFGAWNLRLVQGTAPEALDCLPKPDAVFVGGSGGRMKEILRAAVSANPGVRLCVSAIALETLNEAVATMRELGLSPQISQLAVSSGRRAGALTMMLAQNPVYLIVGGQG